MRVVFFGIYDIGEAALAELLRRGTRPAAVVTKPAGGGPRQRVAVMAEAAGIPVLEPETPRDPAFVERLAALAPELITVAGYHKIIPKSVLDLPGHGTLNLHGSLLPRYRGPCTWKWAIMNGEESTGVTVHVMTPELDDGDLLGQRAIPIRADHTGATLFAEISRVGAELLADTVAGIEDGTARRTPQDESQASYFGYPSDDDARIDWSAPAARIDALVRGLHPRPGAWTTAGGRRVRVWAVRPLPGAGEGGEPGRVLRVDGAGVLVSTGDGALLVAHAGLDGEDPLAAAAGAGPLAGLPAGSGLGGPAAP